MHSKIPYTRIIEHKHFEFGVVTYVTKDPNEFSKDTSLTIRYDKTNDKILSRYLAKYKKYYFIEYKHYDMHQVIARSLKIAEKA